MQHKKRNENYLLEPLGKSTTKEDHERIQMCVCVREREREREVVKKEIKPRTVTMSQKVTIKR